MTQKKMFADSDTKNKLEDLLGDPITKMIMQVLPVSYEVNADGQGWLKMGYLDYGIYVNYIIDDAAVKKGKHVLSISASIKFINLDFSLRW